MKRRFSPLLAAASLLAGGNAATRPHYGGTLRIECRDTVTSLDAAGLANSALGAELAPLVYASGAANAPQPADGSPIGDGPFRAQPRQGSGPLVLVANDEYAGPRPFVDRIEITMGRSLRDQALDFDLGKADVIEISPEQARRAQQAGQKIASSAPVELMAMVLQTPAASGDDRVRQALSEAIDRDAIYSILLQRQGQPAGGLLPNWVSGYGFLFPTGADASRARELAHAAGGALKLTLSYDAGDALAKLVAERVALNARDAGILVQTYSELPGRSSNADMRLVRLRIHSADPQVALGELAARLDPAEAARIAGANTPEDLYAAERALIESAHVVPLVYLPETLAIGARVHDWMAPRAGGWPAADAWVEGKP